MYRNRYVVAKCMVVQGIDAEEQHNIDEPTFQWDFVGSKEMRWSGFVELRYVARDGDEQELDECQEGTAGGLNPSEKSSVSIRVVMSCKHKAGNGRTDLMMASRAKTLEQHPPKMRPSMTPTASHCGMVSMKMRPSMPMILEDMGLWSSIPWISAFSREGAALITLGVMGAEAAACCWAFWREEGCRRRVGRVVIYTGAGD